MNPFTAREVPSDKVIFLKEFSPENVHNKAKFILEA